MKISHIVTNGCSFTYCQNLPNQLEQGWPALLAQGFNTPLVNLGLPGVGNDSILRRTYEYIYENLSVDEFKPLVVIQLTQRWRREAWFKTEDDYAIISFPDNKPQNYYEYALLDNWNDEDFIRKTMLYRLSLINMFENLDIPYVIFNYSGAESAFEKEAITLNKFPNMVKHSKNNYDLGDLHELTGIVPRLPCGHDDVPGQNILYNHIFNKLKELYPNLEFVKDAKFLELSKFSKTNRHHTRFPEWCNFKLKNDIIP